MGETINNNTCYSYLSYIYLEVDLSQLPYKVLAVKAIELDN